MNWIARLLSLAIVAATAESAVASVHASTSTFVALAVATIAGGAMLVLAWGRPWIAAAASLLGLFAAYAFAQIASPSAAPTATALSSGDAAAIVLILAIVAASAVMWVAIPQAIVRALVIAVALYTGVAAGASIGHGGLAASFGSAPLAWARGSYVAAEAFLPLAAVTSLVLAALGFARRRPQIGVASAILAIALVAAAQFGAYAAGAAGLPTIVAFEHPTVSGATAPAAAIAAIGTTAVTTPAASEITTAPAVMTTGLATTTASAATATALPAGGANAAASAGSSDAGSGTLIVPKGSDAVAPEIATAFAGVTKDPAHLLAAVAALDNDLYPGALGGAVGAERSGGGNAFDKTLLLRDLLLASDPSIATQFAECTLGDSDADALVSQVRSPAAHRKILLQAASGAVDSTTDPKVRAVLASWSSAWTSVVTKARGEGTALTSSLAAAGVTLPQNVPSPDRVRAVAAHHVWLRANLGGSWTDLDPTIEGSVPGKTRCAAQSTTTSLPDADYDVLGVRVTSETSPEAPQLATLLDRTVRTADVGDRDVSLMFAEPTGMDAGAASTAPAGASPFTPYLLVGGEGFTGTPVILPLPAAGLGVGHTISSGLQSALDVFGTSTASPGPASPPPLPTVSAIWLDLSIAAPGIDAVHVHSPIFDRVGFAARAGKAPAPKFAVEPEAANYRAMQTVWNVAVSAGGVASAAGPEEIAPAQIPAAQSGAALSGVLARMNGAFAGLRRAIMDDASSGAVDVAALRPGITILAMDPDGALSIDNASDDAVPLTPSESRPLFASASLLAERELVDKNKPISAAAGADGASDALALFDDASVAGTKLGGFHPGDTSLDTDAAVPADARARVSARLASGNSVLALQPSAPAADGLPYAYWIADASTGTLRDEDQFGRHDDMAEETVTERPAIKAVPTWRKLACNAIGAFILIVTQDSGLIEGTSIGQYATKAELPPEEQTTCGP